MAGIVKKLNKEVEDKFEQACEKIKVEFFKMSNLNLKDVERFSSLVQQNVLNIMAMEKATQNISKIVSPSAVAPMTGKALQTIKLDQVCGLLSLREVVYVLNHINVPDSIEMETIDCVGTPKEREKVVRECLKEIKEKGLENALVKTGDAAAALKNLSTKIRTRLQKVVMDEGIRFEAQFKSKLLSFDTSQQPPRQYSFIFKMERDLDPATFIIHKGEKISHQDVIKALLFRLSCMEYPFVRFGCCPLKIIKNEEEGIVEIYSARFKKKDRATKLEANDLFMIFESKDDALLWESEMIEYSQEIGSSMNFIRDFSTLKDIPQLKNYHGAVVIYIKPAPNLTLEELLLNKKFSIRLPNVILRLLRFEAWNWLKNGTPICYPSQNLMKLKSNPSSHYHGTVTVEHLSDSEILELAESFKTREGIDDLYDFSNNIQRLITRMWEIYTYSYPGLFVVTQYGLNTVTSYAKTRNLIVSIRSNCIHREVFSVTHHSKKRQCNEKIENKYTTEELEKVLKKIFSSVEFLNTFFM